MSNIKAYHESVTDELDAIKNRIRNLVTHWATDGEWKEAALRSVLRRHLPSSVFVGRGFVMGKTIVPPRSFCSCCKPRSQHCSETGTWRSSLLTRLPPLQKLMPAFLFIPLTLSRCKREG